MAVTEPAIGSSNWGPVVNAALTQLDTIGASSGLSTQTLASAGAVTINASTGQHQKITLGANATSSTITNPSSGQFLVIEWVQDATGGRTYVWPSNMVWKNGVAPNASKGANRSDTFRFVYDGSNWVEVSRSIGGATAAVPPTAAAGANAGTTPPAPIIAAGSTDERGSLTFGTGAGAAAGAQVSVTFGQAYASGPPVVIITPTTAQGDPAANSVVGYYVSAWTATGFTVSTTFAPNASQANTVYGFNWHVDF